MLRSKSTLAVILVFVASSGCSSVRIGNEPFHTEGTDSQCVPSLSDCSKQVVEKHDNFTLAFLEFTERGNQFSRSRTGGVYKQIEALAETPEGAAVVVFVHGWKHNAKSMDTNVIAFRKLLDGFAKNEVYGARNIVGVYVGWRGLSYDIPGLINLTYWDRKAVAEEVGSGGVTEVLTRLQSITVSENNDLNSAPKNAYLVLGHSFGGAIVLSALHDVLVDNLSSSLQHHQGRGAYECRRTSRFADGVVLLNPAIEANRILQVKELSASCSFPENQPNLLHVISSDGDRATNKAFKIGQWLGLVLTWDQELLRRRFGTKDVVLNEVDLDVETIGNYPGFLTGRLEENPNPGPKWRYINCGPDDSSLTACGLMPTEIDNHIPVKNNDPLVFLKTDENFIKDHNDIFNCDVQAYIATIALEGHSKFQYDRNYSLSKSQIKTGCQIDSFEFGICLASQLELFACQ